MKRTLWLSSALLAAAAFGAGAADPVTEWRDWPPDPEWARQPFAGQAPRLMSRATFAMLDTDSDFSLSRAEAAANPAVAANFDSADLDRNGGLAPIEFNNIALALAAD